MIEKTLAKRYAAAMLAVAVKEGLVEQVESNLLALKQVYETDAMFRLALGQPQIPKAARKKLLRKPFEGRAHPAFLDFLDLLVEKNRVTILPDIATMFDELADVTQGVVRVGVRSAFPLNDRQRQELDQQLARVTGKKVVLQESVDKALKGGMAVRIGDTVIDGTVAHRLARLREYLAELQK